MQLIVSTEYEGLLKFLFKELREEHGSIPIRDNFFLIKLLSHTDTRMLDRFQNYVVVSKTFSTVEWGRQEIFDFCKEKTKSRRKPDLEKLSDDEFEKNIKIFLLTGVWISDTEENTMFDLYSNIDSKGGKIKEYFKLRDNNMPAGQIMYSVLTFCGRVLDGGGGNVSKGYMAKIESKKSTISKNFSKAIKTFAHYEGDLDDNKVLKFLMDIGKL